MKPYTTAIKLLDAMPQEKYLPMFKVTETIQNDFIKYVKEIEHGFVPCTMEQYCNLVISDILDLVTDKFRTNNFFA